MTTTTGRSGARSYLFGEMNEKLDRETLMLDDLITVHMC